MKSSAHRALYWAHSIGFILGGIVRSDSLGLRCRVLPGVMADPPAGPRMEGQAPDAGRVDREHGTHLM